MPPIRCFRGRNCTAGTACCMEESASYNFTEGVPLMDETNGSSEKISKTIPATDEIAFQASLLALSAAVEAAAARRSTETAADLARVRKRENNF